MNSLEMLAEAVAAADRVLTASGAVKVPNTQAGGRLVNAYDRLEVVLQAMGVRPLDPGDPVNYSAALALRDSEVTK